MQQDSDAPAWLPGLSGTVERLGWRRALALLTAALLLLALIGSQLLISLLGDGDRLLAGVGASVCAVGFGVPLGYCSLRLVDQLNGNQQALTRHATLDPLTGVFNRRHFLNLVEREWSLAHRYDTDCALVLIDVDRFKRVNDCFGHRCGDTLLQSIAEVGGETLRQADVLARFGGEEFILFLPHTDPLGALDVAERIRERVVGLNYCWNGHSVPVSVSLGVAALSREHLSLEHLIQDAEAALVVAKAAGRNCVRAGEGLLAGRQGQRCPKQA
jgi:diguanylate cyclase (GGDEF)-like protein